MQPDSIISNSNSTDFSWRLLQQNRPEAAENDVRSNVGYWGVSGLVVLTLSFVGHDPLLTYSLLVRDSRQGE
jgi:hypothetical protein